MRLKGAGLTGNKQLSLKCLENGILKGIQYTSRDKTAPKAGGNVSEWISRAPKCCDAGLEENLNPSASKKRKRDETIDDMMQINQKNCLYVAWKYRKDKLVMDPKSQYDKIGDLPPNFLEGAQAMVLPVSRAICLGRSS